MNKNVFFIAILSTIILISGITLYVKNVVDKEKVSAAEEKTNKKKEIDYESKIGGIQYELGINSISAQHEVIEVMHKMTHQKVKAEDKRGATPMTEDTINEVYRIVNLSYYQFRDELMDILEGWKKGNFDTVHYDHNYLQALQGETVGQAYGVMSIEEEKTFISNNFKDSKLFKK